MINFKRMAKDTAFWENEPILGWDDATIIAPEFDGDRDWFIGFGSSYYAGYKVQEHSGLEITVNQAWHELYADLYESAIGARSVFGSEVMDHIDPITYESLIYMVYQMGTKAVSKFHNTIQSLKILARTRDTISREAVRFNMLDSEWFKIDTKKRAQWTADRIIKQERLNPRSYRYVD